MGISRKTCTGVILSSHTPLSVHDSSRQPRFTSHHSLQLHHRLWWYLRLQGPSYCVPGACHQQGSRNLSLGILQFPGDPQTLGKTAPIINVLLCTVVQPQPSSKSDAGGIHSYKLRHARSGSSWQSMTSHSACAIHWVSNS